MINVKNKFEENNLEIEFSGDDIDTKTITVSISDDINFKTIIDYLIEIVPKNLKLESSFDDYSEEENLEKLELIKETIEEVYTEFNQSLENMENQDGDEEGAEINSSSSGDDDLPF